MSKLGEFLLARADTHPEEFYEDRKSGVKHNWLNHVKHNKKFMSEEEYNAIWEKVSAINLDYQMERVTEKLFEPEEETSDDLMQSAAKALSQGRKQFAVTQVQLQMEMMKQQLAKEKKEMLERQKELLERKALYESSPY